MIIAVGWQTTNRKQALISIKEGRLGLEPAPEACQLIRWHASWLLSKICNAAIFFPTNGQFLHFSVLEWCRPCAASNKSKNRPSFFSHCDWSRHWLYKSMPDDCCRLRLTWFLVKLLDFVNPMTNSDLYPIPSHPHSLKALVADELMSWLITHPWYALLTRSIMMGTTIE